VCDEAISTFDRRTIISVGVAGKVKLWDVATGKNTAILDVQADTFIGGAFSPDGKMLALRSNDNAIKLWDVKTGKEIDK
jgi:WD40 repeat protein